MYLRLYFGGKLYRGNNKPLNARLLGGGGAAPAGTGGDPESESDSVVDRRRAVADPHASATEAHRPLHLAAGFLPVTECLLDAGASPQARAAGGATPLHWAALSGFQAVAQVLVGSSGAEANAGGGV